MTVYISPSSKEYIFSEVTNENEAEIMRRLARELQTDLKNIGIDSKISDEGTTPNQAVLDSNAEDYSLHIVLATMQSSNVDERGITILFSSTDGKSRDYAMAIAEGIKQIYPLPQFVRVLPNCSFVELINTNAPAVALFFGNIKNESDAKWLQDNTNSIASNIALSVESVLTKEETTPMSATGIINAPSGYADIRKSPSSTSSVIARVPNGTSIEIIGKVGNWYITVAQNSEGYVLAKEVTAETPRK